MPRLVVDSESVIDRSPSVASVANWLLARELVPVLSTTSVSRGDRVDHGITPTSYGRPDVTPLPSTVAPTVQPPMVTGEMTWASVADRPTERCWGRADGPIDAVDRSVGSWTDYEMWSIGLMLLASNPRSSASLECCTVAVQWRSEGAGGGLVAPGAAGGGGAESSVKFFFSCIRVSAVC